jgi:Leucine-rich repeat (LRR) protein
MEVKIAYGNREEITEQVRILKIKHDKLPNIPIDIYNNLLHLNISMTNIGNIRILPRNLVRLYVNNNKGITRLPELPNTLVTLKCRGNKLTSLPELPMTLMHLDCSHNNITKLPELPLFLDNLNCEYNQIETLSVLNNRLHILICNENKIKNIPGIENCLNLKELHCNGNPITTLPSLRRHYSLKFIDCSETEMHELPELPKTLENLNCSESRLTSLPKLPKNLKQLDCSENKITRLPKLPKKLKKLNANCNNISSVEYDPEYINAEISIQDNPLSYIPNNWRASITHSIIQRNIIDTNIPSLLEISANSLPVRSNYIRIGYNFKLQIEHPKTNVDELDIYINKKIHCNKCAVMQICRETIIRNIRYMICFKCINKMRIIRN